jgi:hypothetical protein
MGVTETIQVLDSWYYGVPAEETGRPVGRCTERRTKVRGQHIPLGFAENRM